MNAPGTRRTINRTVFALTAMLVMSAVPASAAPKKIRPTHNFPIIISNSGSYELQGNLEVPDADTTAILINANDVTIDLAGFTIHEPTVCTGTASTLTCAPTGTGRGIMAFVSENITVRNGTIRGMGGEAVSIYGIARIERMQIIGNGGGVLLGGGIDGFGGRVSDSTISLNGFGPTGFNSGLFIDGDNYIISNNTFAGNRLNGVVINSFDGLLTGNIMRRNGLVGLSVGDPTTAYLQNHIAANDMGPLYGSPTNMGQNLCDGSLCP